MSQSNTAKLYGYLPICKDGQGWIYIQFANFTYFSTLNLFKCHKMV